MPNLVSRTRPSLQIFDITQTRVFPIFGGWGGEGVSECSGCLVFIFFIFKDNCTWVMTRHHVNNILLTRDLPFVFVSDSFNSLHS